MQSLRIEATDKTPLINLDPINGNFEIKGKAVPDNADLFFQNILNWFEDFTPSPNQEIEIVMDLEYFNISSSKRLLFILYKLRDLVENNHKVKVRWMYNEEDEDMFEVGQDYAFMVNVPFDFVSYTLKEALAG